MSNMVEYGEIIAVHPGSYVEDIIEDMGISQAEFAQRLNTTPKTVSKLVNGQINLSRDLAKKLSIMLGTSVEIWLNLQKAYNQRMIEIEKETDYQNQKEILEMIDYKYFVKVCHLEDTNEKHQRLIHLCSYLQLADLRVLKEPDFLLKFRKQRPFEKEKQLVCSKAWFQVALNLSEEMKIQKFNARRLKTELSNIRALNLESPRESIPKLQTIFAECGVAFVYLPHLKGSTVNAAVKWINDEKVVLAINNHGYSAEEFWFSLFHEIGHILQKKIKTTFFEDNESLAEETQTFESEANEFAKEILIPKKEYQSFVEDDDFSKEGIIEFSQKIGVIPGIVVDRLQKEQKITDDAYYELRMDYVSKIDVELF